MKNTHYIILLGGLFLIGVLIDFRVMGANENPETPPPVVHKQTIIKEVIDPKVKTALEELKRRTESLQIAMDALIKSCPWKGRERAPIPNGEWGPWPSLGEHVDR